MEITINLNIPALDKLADALIATAALAQGSTKTPAAVAPKAEAKPAPAKSAPKKEEPAAVEEATEDDGVDYAAQRAEATKLLQAINKANGVDAVRAVLAELDVKNIGAVPDEQLADAVALFQSKLDA